MARELTEQEKLFIAESVLSRDSATERRQETREKRRKRVKNSRVFSAKFWASFVMLFPLLGTILLYIFIFQASATVGGSANLKWLASQKMDAQTKQLLTQYNLDWLPTLLHIYNQRYIIIGIMFTIGIILAMAILMIDAWRKQRYDK